MRLSSSHPLSRPLKILAMTWTAFLTTVKTRNQAENTRPSFSCSVACGIHQPQPWQISLAFYVDKHAGIAGRYCMYLLSGHRVWPGFSPCPFAWRYLTVCAKSVSKEANIKQRFRAAWFARAFDDHVGHPVMAGRCLVPLAGNCKALWVFLVFVVGMAQ